MNKILLGANSKVIKEIQEDVDPQEFSGLTTNITLNDIQFNKTMILTDTVNEPEYFFNSFNITLFYGDDQFDETSKFLKFESLEAKIVDQEYYKEAQLKVHINGSYIDDNRFSIKSIAINNIIIYKTPIVVDVANKSVEIGKYVEGTSQSVIKNGLHLFCSQMY